MKDKVSIEEHLQGLLEVYEEAKAIIALGEILTTEGKVYLAPLNEMRNSLDHVMRAVADPARTDEEFTEARAHLYRAGYDAYSVLLVEMVAELLEQEKRYGRKTMARVYPDYYKLVKPMLQQFIADNRRSRTLADGTRSTGYVDRIDKLQAVREHLIRLTPELERARGKHVRWLQEGRLLVALAGGVLAAVITWLVGVLLR